MICFSAETYKKTPHRCWTFSGSVVNLECLYIYRSYVYGTQSTYIITPLVCWILLVPPFHPVDDSTSIIPFGFLTCVLDWEEPTKISYPDNLTEPTCSESVASAKKRRCSFQSAQRAPHLRNVLKRRKQEILQHADTGHVQEQTWWYAESAEDTIEHDRCNNPRNDKHSVSISENVLAETSGRSPRKFKKIYIYLKNCFFSLSKERISGVKYPKTILFKSSGNNLVPVQVCEGYASRSASRFALPISQDYIAQQACLQAAHPTHTYHSARRLASV